MLGLHCHEFPRFATGLEERGKKDYNIDHAKIGADMLRQFEDFLISIVTPGDAVYAVFEPLLDNAISSAASTATWFGHWAAMSARTFCAATSEAEVSMRSGTGWASSVFRCLSLPAGMCVRSRRLPIQTRWLLSELAARMIDRSLAGSARRLVWPEARSDRRSCAAASYSDLPPQNLATCWCPWRRAIAPHCLKRAEYRRGA
jgi:hypothetical protein